MKISVITCTWNSEPYLAESIASVLMQDHPDIEYIFVDGGSTDGTLERILAIKRDVKVLRDIRGGISRAMNEGWRIATGDVIAHLHSDDYYLAPDVLSRVDRILSNGAGWAFGRIVRDVSGLQVSENYVAPAYSKRRLLRGNFVPHPATFVRRDWIEKIGGFDESLKYAMDYDLWLKLAHLGDPVTLSGPLTAFREHAGSLSTRNRLAATEEDYFVRMRYVGINPIARLEHLARFLVRRRRVLSKLHHHDATLKAEK